MKQTVCITGAGSGIGKATAFALAQKGYIVLATTETQDQATTLTQEADKKDISLTVWKLDVTDSNDQKTLQDKHIDVMIHNAGIAFTGSLVDIPVEKVRQNFEVNLFAILEINKIILPAMLKRKSGKIIAISSIAGRLPLPFFAPYGMTKFALSTGIYDLHKELKSIDSGVSVSVVEPGAYHTGFNQQMVESRREWMDKESPFYASHEERLAKDLKQFETIEVKSLNSIVDAIVRATTDKNAKFRYSTPWWQVWGVQLLRILGI